MSAPVDLCTLDQVKAYLGITDTNSDVVLAELITAASTFAESYCGRSFHLNTYTNEVYDGPGGRVLILKQFPIEAVTSVVVDLTTIPLSTGPSVSGYTFDDLRVILRGYCFNMDLANVAVSYSAGYSTIPEDLVEATMALVALKYRTKSQIGATSRGIAGETISYSPKDMPSQTVRVYGQYQRASLVPMQ